MCICNIVLIVRQRTFIMIGTTTPVVVWAAFMAVAGLGDGMCTNMPYTAIQAIFDE